MTSATLLALPSLTAAQPAPADPTTGGELVIVSEGELNPTARTVTMTVPLRDSGRYLGDVIVSIDAQDRVSVSTQRVLELLAQSIEEDAVDRLKKLPSLSTKDLAEAGITLTYNAQELALEAGVAAGLRSSRAIEIAGLDEAYLGTLVEPARFSAFLNGRTNIDYLHGDGGLQSPLVFMDGAARFGSIVAEGEGFLEPGRDAKFTRAGSRLIYDDRKRMIRWTAGDLQPIGRGFQALPEIAGLSVFRSYGVLEPQRIAQPRGNRSFALTRPSTIEVTVNGQVVRRLQLEPGNYDLRDFPFTQGANDVRLLIRDDAGRSQTLSFNVFLDQNQLGAGLTEFGFYAGVLAPTGVQGREYSDSIAATGFIRRGITDGLTLGMNAQGDSRAQMAGIEGVWSSALGTLAGTLSLSRVDGRGVGHAALLTFQRLIKRTESADSLNLFVERRSKDFGALGILQPVNPFAWEAGGGYSRGFGSNIFAGIDGRYSKGRGDQRTVYSTRGTVGLRVSGSLNIAGEVRWERDNFERRLSGLITATVRLGRYSNIRADYDTRYDRARVSFSTFRGYGVGSYNVTGDIDYGDSGSGFNVTGNYLANRAELGVSHFGSFDNLFGSSLSQRTSLRLASSIAFADGTFSVGRPIYDSFAIVRGHRSLRRASVEVERTPFGYVSETGALGTAVHPTLASYLTRTVTVDAPDAPVTADLGQGSFKLFPPYRSGYLLTVGSAFNVTAVGRLLGPEGAPLSLISGTVRQDTDGGQEVAIFTNREGRFGASGLGPGTWTVRMNDDDRSTYSITIEEGAEGVVKVGELRPAAQRGQY